MIRQFALPHPRLRCWIDRYWCWQPAAGTDMPALLPGTGAELWFHLGTPPSGIDGRLPQAHVLLARAKPLVLQTAERTHMIAVRFRNSGLFRLFGVPLDGLADQLAPLAELMPASHDDVTETLQGETCWAAQVMLLDNWLLGCLAQREESPFGSLVEQHYYQQSISHGYSSRQFQRLFRQYTGVSARRFQRLRRFQQLTRTLLLNAKPEYLDEALAAGYYDQAHFIRDFRELSGETPGRFLMPRNFNRHFYQHSVSTAIEKKARAGCPRL